MMSKDNNIDFSVSTTFQERLSKASLGDERSNVEIAKEIGISKDVFIWTLKTELNSHVNQNRRPSGSIY